VPQIDAGKRKPQNEPVRRAFLILAGFAFALVLAAAIGVRTRPADFALARGCTAASRHAPAAHTGRTPCDDDVRMSDDAVVPASGEGSTIRCLTPLAIRPATNQADQLGAVAARHCGSFTRPHDPSRLHTLALLI